MFFMLFYVFLRFLFFEPFLLTLDPFLDFFFLGGPCGRSLSHCLLVCDGPLSVSNQPFSRFANVIEPLDSH